ncbi:bifunctional folylpolyglutamate synthase/dihydrofolate synthase [Rubrobacter aplysinae]|uniref:bifunctional folylpolyglutamate synthase/dihydrofolate synthase n=1 Tax=Rubrobacter aplysinae TaxID=909625 RepID=UPI000AD28C7D|nr:cyanophycin synthetase [Rubrobacter aplysinae]
MQVVGTNGKGTTALSLARALGAEGHPAGAYLSPHLISYTERVRLGGRYASEEEFAAGMGRAIRTADEHGISASQFELLTAGALLMFAEAGLSWAVLEAGLGARHDATSAAGAEAVVLTNVALDHTEYLGDTVEEIAAEKLASLHSGSTLILGSGDRTVVQAARRACESVGAGLVEAWDSELDPAETPELASLAPYARRNVALGLRAAGTLLGHDVRSETRREVAARTGLPGRFERAELRGVPVVVDGGHNPAGLAAALDGVCSVYPGRPLGVVFAALRGKDIPSMLAALKDRADSLRIVRPDNERAAEPGWIQREFGPRDSRGRGAELEGDVGEALERAVAEMEETGGVVLVTGSLYTAAEALSRLRRSGESGERLDEGR